MADTRESSRNERLNRLLECSSEGICEVDAQGRCTDANAAGAHLLGYDECELVGAVLSALEQIRELEQQRGEVWEQAAHDLRGNLSVVANVTVGLTRHGRSAVSRADFVRILTRNVTSLHHLLDDVTSLARLQAGRERRQIESLDVTPILQALCEGIRPLAVQRGLYLKCEGPAGFATDGDAVKIRRIAQNLILNAIKYTHRGGITATWGDSRKDDPRRWILEVKDTGSGFHTESGQPLAAALVNRNQFPRRGRRPGSEKPRASSAISRSPVPRPAQGAASLAKGSAYRSSNACVKCSMRPSRCSPSRRWERFRIFFPRHYSK